MGLRASVLAGASLTILTVCYLRWKVRDLLAAEAEASTVMGQFVKWRDFFMTHRKGDLLEQQYPFLSFTPLDPLELDVRVPDDLWKSQEVDPDSLAFDFSLDGEISEEFTE